MFGGLTSDEHMRYSRDVEIYSPESNRWRVGGRLPFPLFEASAAAYGGLIFIFGGFTEHGMNGDVVVYETEQDTAFVIGRMPEPRRAMGCALTNGRILLMGGIRPRGEVARNGYWYDCESGEFTEAPALNQPAYSLGVVINSGIWAIGGVFITPLDRVEKVHGDVWQDQPRQRLPQGIGLAGITLFEDTLIVYAGGLSNRGPISAAFALSTRNGGWQRLPSMQRPRLEFPLVVLGGRVYAIGGSLQTEDERNHLLATVEVLYRTDDVRPKNQPTSPTLLSVWPNPVNGVASISIPSGSAGYTLFDLGGRLLLRERTAGRTQFQFSTSPYPSGIYLIQAVDPQGDPLATTRLVIDR